MTQQAQVPSAKHDSPRLISGIYTSGGREPTLEFPNHAIQVCRFLFNFLVPQLGLVMISNSEVMVRLKLGIVLVDDALGL